MATRETRTCTGKICKQGDSVTMALSDLIPDIIPEEKKPIDPPMVYEEYDEDDFEDEYDE